MRLLVQWVMMMMMFYAAIYFTLFSLQALLTLFVFSTKDGWVTIMYDGIDAVGIDKQVPFV